MQHPPASADPNGTIRQLKRISRRRRDGLIRFAYDNTSQSGEDGIIHYLFEKLSESDSSNSSNSNGNVGSNAIKRWVVDVGAWDGVHLSNTYSLLVPNENGNDNDNTTDNNHKKKNRRSSNTSTNTGSKSTSTNTWRGILIEADETKFKQLHSLHKPLDNICHNIAVSCQPWSQHSLSNILLLHSKGSHSDNNSNNNGDNSDNNATYLPNDFDFLCIDVDGTDYWLLHDLFTNTKYRPKVICIEFNPTIPHTTLFIPPRDDNIRQGCSITALEELASSFGYVLVETTCYNTFFVLRSLFDNNNNTSNNDNNGIYRSIKDDIPFEPNIDNLHEITMGTDLYQLYDGTIKLAGCQKLLWHRRPIREEDVQVLKNKNERNFPFAPEPLSVAGDVIDAEKEQQQQQQQQQHQQQQKEFELKQEEMMYRYSAVDMSPYCCPSPTSASSSPSPSTSNTNSTTTIKEKRSKCSSEIYNQLKRDGFALVYGTNIKSNICQNALKWTNVLLQDASEKVRRSSIMRKDRARRGYSPQNSENFASLIGTKGSNDLVRKFRIGSIADMDTVMNTTVNTTTSIPTTIQQNSLLSSSSSSSSSTASTLLQPNAWPTIETWGEDNATQFQSSIQTYYDHISKAAHAIVNAICDGITTHNTEIILPSSLIGNGVDIDIDIDIDIDTNTNTGIDTDSDTPGTIDTSCNQNDTSILTLLGYRKGARHQGRHSTPLVAAHTDVGVITVLLFDGGDSAVLQRSKNNKNSNYNSPSWVDVKLPKIVPDDPIFIVNIGDCLSDMCNGILPSTLHRVVPCKGGTTPRNCLALFMGLKPDEMLHLPNNGDDNVDCVTYEEWRRLRIARAQAELNKHKK